MRRREFIAGLGSAAVAWPLAARAQQPAVPVVGYLGTQSADDDYKSITVPFLRGLKETGYVQGQNVAVEYRWAEGQPERLPALAADLVRRRVAVIAASGTASALAAKAATTTIPIVFINGSDPVKIGLVTNLPRPEANVTGFSSLDNALNAQRLGLLHELVPTATTIGFLIDPTNPNAEPDTADMQAAAGLLGLKLVVASASTASEVETAIANLVGQHIEALVVAANALFIGLSPRIAELALRQRLPAIYPWAESAEAGGLMSDNGSYSERNRGAGIYAGRILNGEKLSDLPVQLVTRFVMVVNLKAARALGIEVPETLLAIADEVIQ
jgi:putative ABC transport system substrate-binding protein